MVLESARKPHAPVLSSEAPNASNGNDVYGTFGGHDVAMDTINTTSAARPSGYGAMLRAVSVAGLMLVAANYVTSIGFSTVSTSSSSHVTKPLQLQSSAGLLNDIEQQFLVNVDHSRIREYLHAYASSPHSAGTAQDYQTAVYTAQQLESFGIRAEIREYYPLLSKPKHRRVVIVAPPVAARELNLTEGSAPGDKSCTSTANNEVLPPFLAYAASGNVTSSVVYANFGSLADFQWLVDQNVSLAGKIALVRYGGSFRSTKVMLAEQHDMAGVLIYSDPNDDGFGKGPVYPDGPWRPEDSFQRGSIDYLQIAAGDPLTPGFPSKPGAPYLKYEECNSIPHIPALPLSYGQAKYILNALKGKKAPSNWQGGLTLDDGYYVGDDAATVINLELDIDNSIGPIWDVIGTIEGAEEPEQQVLIGNHRDAWVCGAVDPNSGSSTMLEIARGFGELLKQGWQPRRTIKMGPWDGEEYGLLGSTEYIEEEAKTLTAQAVAYVNVDSFLGPLVSGAGTPSIANFLQETAKAIPANRFYGNETEATLYEQWVNQQAARVEANGGNHVAGTLAPDYLISLLGSGTDFTGFYQHLGIISANIRFFLHDGPYGVYHSDMDSLMYSTTEADPECKTKAVMAQWWGLLTLRLADNELLPFDYSTYGIVMAEQLKLFEIQFAALSRTADFSELKKAIKMFTINAQNLQNDIMPFTKSDNMTVDTTLIRQWNDKLVRLERYLLLDTGLPHRPWYKHVIFGPGYYEGYDGTAFPGIADSILFHDNATTTQEHIDAVAQVVQRAADYIVKT